MPKTQQRFSNKRSFLNPQTQRTADGPALQNLGYGPVVETGAGAVAGHSYFAKPAVRSDFNYGPH